LRTKEKLIGYVSYPKTVCGRMATATDPGAQTERRGGAV
jgi:hypothetical protein